MFRSGTLFSHVTSVPWVRPFPLVLKSPSLPFITAAKIEEVWKAALGQAGKQIKIERTCIFLVGGTKGGSIRLVQAPQISHIPHTLPNSFLGAPVFFREFFFLSLIPKNSQLWMLCHQTIPATMHHLLTPGSMFPYFLMKKWYTATTFKTIFKFQWFHHLHRWFFQHSGLFILWGHCLQLTRTTLILATHSKFQIWIITNACNCSNIPISVTPPSDNHLSPSSLFLLRHNFIYPLILQCMDSPTFFLSHFFSYQT